MINFSEFIVQHINEATGQMNPLFAGDKQVAQLDRFGAALTGSAKSCIDGVEYLQFASGVTVKYNRDGSISTCK